MRNSSQKALAPTLWRTCRALANRRRLTILSALLRGGERTVSQVSQAAHVSLVTASEYLRALNARGLLRSSRRGRHVLYRAGADPVVPQAGILLRALRRSLGARPAPIDEVFADLTGFTHPRRMEIMQILARGPQTEAELAGQLGMSRRSAHRHLRKLHMRGYIAKRGSRYERARPRTLLASVLSHLAAT